MIRGSSHPPPRHHPPQQLPHATFEPHHRTVVVRGVKERSTLAQRMTSRSRQMSLRAEASAHTRFVFVLTYQPQEEPLHAATLKVVQFLVASADELVVERHAHSIVAALRRMTVDRQMQPLIHPMVLAVLVEPQCTPPRICYLPHA